MYDIIWQVEQAAAAVTLHTRQLHAAQCSGRQVPIS